MSRGTVIAFITDAPSPSDLGSITQISNQSKAGMLRKTVSFSIGVIQRHQSRLTLKSAGWSCATNILNAPTSLSGETRVLPNTHYANTNIGVCAWI